MFSVFREWWVLKKLRFISLKGAAKSVSKRKINYDIMIPKTIFLFGIVDKIFLLIPRKENQKNLRIAKDIKILEKSKNRVPPLIEEKTYAQIAQKITNEGNIQTFITENNIKTTDIQFMGDKSLQDDLLIKITGDGAAFTFGIAFAEFYKKAIHTYWPLIVLISSAIISSPYLVLIREWSISHIKKIL